MISEKKLRANRANAQKSTGPRSAEGRAASSQNALRHIMLGRSVLLRCEDPARFRDFTEHFYLEFRPRTATEIALVNTMATARWRLIRMSGIEAAGIDLEYARQIEPAIVPADFGTPDRAALAVRDAVRNSKLLDYISRTESRLHRQFDSALDRLLKLRASRGAVQDEAPQSAPEIDDMDCPDEAGAVGEAL